MPIPNPSNKEKKSGKSGREEFISRCMHSLKNENKPQAQKLAICFSQYKNSKRRKQVKGDKNEPVWDEQENDSVKILPNI